MSKKILAVALAAAMILGLASVAFAASFSDTVDHEREIAIKQLAGLGLLNGYEDGTFRPDNPITRAEFAKVMVYALGLKDAAEMLAGVPVPFTDVEANHWATGYISISTSQEIVKGYPDGTFGPQNNVTYAEVLTMILRALGYGPILDKGPWPTAYLTKAAELKLNKGINVLSNAPATRGDVAGLVANAISKPKLIPVAWGPDGNPTQYGVSKGEDLVTLLHDMGAESVDGWLIDSPELFSNDGTEIRLADATGAMDLVEGTDCTGLLGHKVRAWVNDEGQVFFVEDITPESDVREGTYVEIKKDEESKDIGVTLKVNKKNVDFLGDVVFYNYGDAALGTADLENAEITVTFDGDTPMYVVAKEYVWGVVEVASPTYERITFEEYGPGGRATLRVADYDVVWVGAADSFEDLEADDVVEYIVNSTHKKAVFVVTRNAVEGEFSKLATKATVDGTDYDVVAGAVGVGTGNLGYDVIALLNKDGDIVMIKKVSDAPVPSSLAVVLDMGVEEDAFDNRLFKIRLFLTDGSKAVVDLASKVAFGDADAAAIENLDALKAKLAKGDVISYKTNSSGAITSIKTKVAFTQIDDAALAINDTRSTVNNLKVSSDTIAFNITTNEGARTFKGVEVITGKTLLSLANKDLFDGTLLGYVDPDGGFAGIVVARDAVTAASELTYGMVYGSYQAKVGSDVEWLLRILVDGSITDYPATYTGFDIDDFDNETIVTFQLVDDEIASAAALIPDISSDVYKARVADVDLENGLITIELKDDDTGHVKDAYYLFVDEDTLYYDVAGSTRASLTLEEITREAEVDVYVEGVPANGALVKVLVIQSY
ncbi:MAG TPA: S-layer homology domain-containing protein [Firmicutes bacterium]|nr:S-layer homology domain-containing protein [Candidatus Fermentithermobacillaceae bacterium]